MVYSKENILQTFFSRNNNRRGTSFLPPPATNFLIKNEWAIFNYFMKNGIINNRFTELKLSQIEETH